MAPLSSGAVVSIRRPKRLVDSNRWYGLCWKIPDASNKRFKYHHWPRPLRLKYKDIFWFRRRKMASSSRIATTLRCVYGNPYNL